MNDLEVLLNVRKRATVAFKEIVEREKLVTIVAVEKVALELSEVTSYHIVAVFDGYPMQGEGKTIKEACEKAITPAIPLMRLQSNNMSELVDSIRQPIIFAKSKVDYGRCRECSGSLGKGCSELCFECQRDFAQGK
jgi:hypothetical protein